MSESDDLVRRAVGGLRVVAAVAAVQEELAAVGGQDPADLILADLMVRHAESAERAAMALRLLLHGEYGRAEAKWGGT